MSKETLIVTNTNRSSRLPSVVYASMLLLAGLEFTLCSAFGQISTASINGTVRDSAGAVAPGAAIVLRNVETGVEARTITNEVGNYVLLSILPGTYTLEAAKEGFTTSRLTPFALAVNQTPTFNFRIEVGVVQQSVTVEAVGAQVQSSTAELGMVITQKQVLNLPIMGRDFQQLMQLSPGVNAVSTGQSNIPSVNGQVNRSSLFFLDGVNNNAAMFNQYSVAPILDAIEEFKVQSHNDSAEFGGVLGGTINAATKSGTNELHGTVWEYLRNDAFNAREYYLNSVAPFKENTFGATAGGPVYVPKLYNGRNRTFFFFGYQGYRYRSPANTFFRVPTAANLDGDLSDWPRQIYDPFSTRVNPERPGTFIRDPFPANRIPANRLVRGMVAYAKTVLPAPVQTGLADQNALDATPIHNNNEEINIRIDQNFGPKDAAWFRYSGSFQTITQSGGLPSIGQTTNTHRSNMGGSWTHTFGPSALLQAQFGHSFHRDEIIKRLGSSPAEFRNQVGYSDNLLAPYVDGQSFFPAFNVAQFFSGGESRIFRKPGDTWQPKATFSKIHGSHTLKMGGEFNTMRYMLINETPSVGFNSPQTADPLNLGRTGSPLASFLLGVPDSASRRNILETQPWGIVAGFFIQDQWKVSPKLTVNLGLRYDRTFIPPSGREEDGNNEVGSMDLNRGVYVLEKLSPPCEVRRRAPCIPTPGGALPAHVELSPNGRILRDATKNFQPRLGIAYRVGAKTALRAGAGVYFDNWSGMVQTSRNFSGSWPSLGYVSLSNLNYPTQAQPIPAVKATDPLPSAVFPEPTPFNQVNYFPDPNWKNAYSMQWNGGIQHEISTSTVLTANYVGSGGRRTDVGGYYNVARTPGPGNPRDRSPFPYITPTQYDRSIGRSNYHAFQFQLERRWARGGAYGVAYTWSKSIDTGSSDFFKTGTSTSIQDPYHYSNDRSVSGFDLTHVLNLNWVYQLPLGRGKLLHSGSRSVDYILGNWQFNGIARMRSGVPFNLSVAGDVANTANVGYMRPNLVGDPDLSNPRPEQWFNQAAIAVPAPFTFGNFGRNRLRTDWTRTLDLSMFRQIPIRERLQAQFRAEAFNAFNTPIFGAPVGDITNVNFGRVLNVGGARVLQLSLKIIF